MELLVKRLIKSHYSTIGRLYINGLSSFDTLEPTDRGLTQSMTLDQISHIKVKNQTAIPTGRYRVTKYASSKHGGAFVPLLEDVYGFDFVEIHVGNYPHDTDACLLLGLGHSIDMVTSSKDAISQFYPKFFAALDSGESVFITYE